MNKGIVNVYYTCRHDYTYIKFRDINITYKLLRDTLDIYFRRKKIDEYYQKLNLINNYNKNDYIPKTSYSIFYTRYEPILLECDMDNDKTKKLIEIKLEYNILDGFIMQMTEIISMEMKNNINIDNILKNNRIIYNNILKNGYKIINNNFDLEYYIFYESGNKTLYKLLEDRNLIHLYYHMRINNIASIRDYLNTDISIVGLKLYDL